MMKGSLVLFLIVFCFSCQKNTASKENIHEDNYEEIIHNYYELYLSKKSKATLILFGGFPEDPNKIKKEFNIISQAKENDINVLLMNYNKKLFLKQYEKEQLVKELENIFFKHSIPSKNICIGGFSSGGNIALLLSNYIIEKQKKDVIPQNVFIIDSPIDLLQLYYNSEENVKNNFSDVAIQEGKWLMKFLEQILGDPVKDFSKYEQNSVYTLKTKNIDNLNHLKNTKIRLYSEPDTAWWQENRKINYQQINAFQIEQFFETLQKNKFKNVKYITSKNKGYRSDGERHPHSWSIVDVKDLIHWILN